MKKDRYKKLLAIYKKLDNLEKLLESNNINSKLQSASNEVTSTIKKVEKIRINKTDLPITKQVYDYINEIEKLPNLLNGDYERMEKFIGSGISKVSRKQKNYERWMYISRAIDKYQKTAFERFLVSLRKSVLVTRHLFSNKKEIAYKNLLFMLDQLREEYYDTIFLMTVMNKKDVSTLQPFGSKEKTKKNPLANLSMFRYMKRKSIIDTVYRNANKSIRTLKKVSKDKNPKLKDIIKSIFILTISISRLTWQNFINTSLVCITSIMLVIAFIGLNKGSVIVSIYNDIENAYSKTMNEVEKTIAENGSMLWLAIKRIFFLFSTIWKISIKLIASIVSIAKTFTSLVINRLSNIILSAIVLLICVFFIVFYFLALIYYTVKYGTIGFLSFLKNTKDVLTGKLKLSRKGA